MINRINQSREHAWKDDGVYGYMDHIGKLIWESSITPLPIGDKKEEPLGKPKSATNPK